jgi:hypothetical protein
MRCLNNQVPRPPALLVDIESGDVLDAPQEATVSRNWIESHPFVQQGSGKEFIFLFAGRDAERRATHRAAEDFVQYAIRGDVAGFVRLERVA